MSERPGPALDVDGPAAPPRRNGELVFEAPWESRLFGLTLALCERGLCDWDEFRAGLIAEIGDWERARDAGSAGPWSYYACWQRALEKLLAARGHCPAADLDARTRTLAARPPGHDHG